MKIDYSNQKQVDRISIRLFILWAVFLFGSIALDIAKLFKSKDNSVYYELSNGKMVKAKRTDSLGTIYYTCPVNDTIIINQQ